MGSEGSQTSDSSSGGSASLPDGVGDRSKNGNVPANTTSNPTPNSGGHPNDSHAADVPEFSLSVGFENLRKTLCRAETELVDKSLDGLKPSDTDAAFQLLEKHIREWNAWIDNIGRNQPIQESPKTSEKKKEKMVERNADGASASPLPGDTRNKTSSVATSTSRTEKPPSFLENIAAIFKGKKVLPDSGEYTHLIGNRGISSKTPSEKADLAAPAKRNEESHERTHIRDTGTSVLGTSIKGFNALTPTKQREQDIRNQVARRRPPSKDRNSTVSMDRRGARALTTGFGASGGGNTPGGGALKGRTTGSKIDPAKSDLMETNANSSIANAYSAVVGGSRFLKPPSKKGRSAGSQALAAGSGNGSAGGGAGSGLARSPSEAGSASPSAGSEFGGVVSMGSIAPLGSTVSPITSTDMGFTMSRRARTSVICTVSRAFIEQYDLFLIAHQNRITIDASHILKTNFGINAAYHKLVVPLLIFTAGALQFVSTREWASKPYAEVEPEFVRTEGVLSPNPMYISECTRVPLPPWHICWLSYLIAVAALFVACHRVVRSLAFRSLVTFDSLLVFLSTVQVATMRTVNLVDCYGPNSSHSFDAIVYLVALYGFISLAFVIFVFVDAYRISVASKRLTMGVLAAYAFYQSFLARLSSDGWSDREDLKISILTAKPRQQYASAMGTLALVSSKHIMIFIRGKTLSNIRTTYDLTWVNKSTGEELTDNEKVERENKLVDVHSQVPPHLRQFGLTNTVTNMRQGNDDGAHADAAAGNHRASLESIENYLDYANGDVGKNVLNVSAPPGRNWEAKS